MERNHEPISPYLVKWNSLISIHLFWTFPLTFIVTYKPIVSFFTFQFVPASRTFKMFIFLQHLFHFLHLQENLVYITCKESISSDLIYYITKGDSVFIRSIYQYDSNTLLVDLNVPTGELDYNLTTTLIEVCNKYFFDYQGDRFVLEAYLANSYLEDPRIIQDYSFYLVEGYMPEGSSLFGYQLLLNYYHLSPMESLFYTP